MLLLLHIHFQNPIVPVERERPEMGRVSKLEERREYK